MRKQNVIFSGMIDSKCATHYKLRDGIGQGTSAAKSYILTDTMSIFT